MRPPVRLLALLACLLAVGGAVAAFSGCGSDDAAGPLDSSLSYLPKDTPFAVVVDTDTGGDQYKALDALFKKFPFGGAIKEFILARSPRRPPGSTSRRTSSRCSATRSWSAPQTRSRS